MVAVKEISKSDYNVTTDGNKSVFMRRDNNAKSTILKHPVWKALSSSQDPQDTGEGSPSQF